MRNILLALLVSSFWAGSTWAEAPVYFADLCLKAAVERDLFLSDPTPTDMLLLTKLECVGDIFDTNEVVTDLTGLEYATNLQTLRLRRHQIGDISVLSHLSNLENLDLSQNRISDLSPLSGLSNLTQLNLHANRISDLSPLSGLSHVNTLILRFNEISDISPLSGMTNLRDLDLGSNRISNLEPLSSLTGLSTLALWHNDISDITPLSNMVDMSALKLDMNHISDIAPLSALGNLRDLDLASNEVSDISPLCALTSLMSLNLRNNPLPQKAYDVLIPLIAANNPRIHIEHDSHAGRLLLTSSAFGGSVVDPGEGEFLYEHNTLVRLEAKPAPGFVFAGWSGTYPTPLNPAYITLSQDYEMRATFLSLLDTLYVDDDASDDPGPGDAALSDPKEDGTAEHPFDRIQEAIEVAGEGTTIIVPSGTYHENIDLLGKNIHLTAMDSNDPTSTAYPVIKGTGAGPVVRFEHGEGPQCLLTGFVITAGRGQPAGAILCDGASPTLAHCLIVGNRCTDPDGAILCCEDSRAVLTNCTIADNYAGKQGTTLMLLDSNVTVLDSILWNTALYEVLASGTSEPDIRYCCVHGWWPDWGNIHKDPLFARLGVWATPENPGQSLGPENPQTILVHGDYHVKSQAGRWHPPTQSWVQDEVTSPAIDAGLASSPVGHEPAPNGGRINMGVYGGTPEASKSHSKPLVP